jgi:hypothetical protein
LERAEQNVIDLVAQLGGEIHKTKGLTGHRSSSHTVDIRENCWLSWCRAGQLRETDGAQVFAVRNKRDGSC